MKRYYQLAGVTTKETEDGIIQYLNHRNIWKGASGGTTATLVEYKDKIVNIAHVGDCPVLLIDSTGNYKLLTADHSPLAKSEYQRLKHNFDFKYGSRREKRLQFDTLIYNQYDQLNDIPVDCCKKGPRKIPYTVVFPKGQSTGLNMTRSLGDFSLQFPTEPHTASYPVSPEQILVVGSDGFFDKYTFAEIAQLVVKFKQLNATEIVNELMKDALDKQQKYVFGFFHSISYQNNMKTACALNYPVVTSGNFFDGFKLIFSSMPLFM